MIGPRCNILAPTIELAHLGGDQSQPEWVGTRVPDARGYAP